MSSYVNLDFDNIIVTFYCYGHWPFNKVYGKTVSQIFASQVADLALHFQEERYCFV